MSTLANGPTINGKTKLDNGTATWLSSGKPAAKWDLLSLGERLIKLRPIPTDPRAN